MSVSLPLNLCQPLSQLESKTTEYSGSLMKRDLNLTHHGDYYRQWLWSIKTRFYQQTVTWEESYPWENLWLVAERLTTNTSKKISQTTDEKGGLNFLQQPLHSLTHMLSIFCLDFQQSLQKFSSHRIKHKFY